MRCIIVLESSFPGKQVEIQAAQRVTKKLRARHDVNYQKL